MSRFVIGGLEHLVRVISTNPQILALSSLSPLQEIGRQAAIASQSCGCNATKVFNDNKVKFEMALNNLSNGDHITMKRILGVDQLCWQVRGANGLLKLKCI